MDILLWFVHRREGERERERERETERDKRVRESGKVFVLRVLSLDTN